MIVALLVCASGCASSGPVDFGVAVGERIKVEQCGGALEFELPLHTRQLPLAAPDACSAWYRSAYLESHFLFGFEHFSSCREADQVGNEQRGSYEGQLYRCRKKGREVLHLELRSGVNGLSVTASYNSATGERQARELIESVRVLGDPWSVAGR